MGISSPSQAIASRPRPRARVNEDLITSGFGLWLIIGLFTDGWAHHNLPNLETFFTPWHAALYSGFAASAGWMVHLARRNRRRGFSWRQALPIGYPLAAVGVAIFGVGGIGDMLWHTIFGVEVGIDALLSPTHLVLLTGGLLVVTAALRSGWARPSESPRPHLRAELPAALSLGLATSLGAFFLLYVSVFSGPAAATPVLRVPEGTPGHEAAEQPVVLGVAGYIVTTMLLVVPALLAERAGRRPAGLIALVVGMVAWLSAAIDDFSTYAVYAATLVSVGALFVEAAAALIVRSVDRPAARLVSLGAVIPAPLWLAQLVAVALSEGLQWTAALTGGVVALSVLIGAALGLLAGWTPQETPTQIVANAMPSRTLEV